MHILDTQGLVTHQTDLALFTLGLNSSLAPGHYSRY
jgi:hypothetical protein